MSFEKRGKVGGRRGRGAGWTGSDSRDDARGAADEPPPAKPQVDARGRAIITPNGFPLYL